MAWLIPSQSLDISSKYLIVSTRLSLVASIALRTKHNADRLILPLVPLWCKVVVPRCRSAVHFMHSLAWKTQSPWCLPFKWYKRVLSSSSADCSYSYGSWKQQTRSVKEYEKMGNEAYAIEAQRELIFMLSLHLNWISEWGNLVFCEYHLGSQRIFAMCELHRRGRSYVGKSRW